MLVLQPTQVPRVQEMCGSSKQGRVMCNQSKECNWYAQNSVIQSAISIVQEQHYISFSALCRKLDIEENTQTELLEELRNRCRVANSVIGEVDEDRANGALLQATIFYSNNWAGSGQWPQTVELKIGCDLYYKILENNWNDYGGGRQVKNSHLNENYLDHVIRWQMGFFGDRYAWEEFRRFYHDLTTFECELGENEVITCFVPGVDAYAFRNIEPTGIVRTNVVVNAGDILVGKIRIRGETGNPFDGMEVNISDTSFRVPAGVSGVVAEVLTDQGGGLKKWQNRIMRNLDGVMVERLRNPLLGEQLGVDIVDTETQTVVVPANRTITSAYIRRIVRRRDNVTTDDVNVLGKLRTVFDEFRPYCDAVSGVVAKIRRVQISLKMSTCNE